MKFREYLNESLKSDDILDKFYDAMEAGNSKFDEEFWEFLESELSSEGIDFGNATPDELLNKLSDKQLQRAYKLFSHKFKKLF